MFIRIEPGGGIRATHDDHFPFAELGCSPPVRASHVEPIQSGPNAGRWYADMSPLGSEFSYCLWPPTITRREALDQERQHIEKHWIKGDRNATT